MRRVTTAIAVATLQGVAAGQASAWSDTVHADLQTLVHLSPSNPSTGFFCSLEVAPGNRSDSTTVLLATASPDTVLAGPGRVQPSEFGGHSGSGAPGPIFGQLVDVARFGGADSLRLARAFERGGHTTAIIVPWDYDPACEPSRWANGFVWVEPGGTGTFELRLREDSLWIDGVPVLDAFTAVFEPYPLSPVYLEDSHRRAEFWTDPQLTAEQYFELLLSLPTIEERRANPESAWQVYLRWAGAHPDLAGQYPANQAARSLALAVASAKKRRMLRGIVPPTVGTWEMWLSLDDGAERRFYLRTRQHPMNEWRNPGVPPTRSSNPVAEPERPDAYSILVSTASSVDALPTNCTTNRDMSAEGYVYVIDPPSRGDTPATEWQGWLEVNGLATAFPDDASLDRFRRQAFEEWMARQDVIEQREAPARYFLDNGVLHLEQTIRLQDGRTLAVRGRRISDDVISCSW
ncbi:MAG TPA: hypothetical protein VFU02_21630 [Polyangiaceae bacterium]|nr:hypothetical protein [Polyangiaceae bacterium]